MVRLMSPHFLALGVGLELLFATIDFLVLARASGENDKAFAIGLQAGDIGGERLDGEIGAARVDTDANSRG